MENKALATKALNKKVDDKYALGYQSFQKRSKAAKAAAGRGHHNEAIDLLKENLEWCIKNLGRLHVMTVNSQEGLGEQHSNARQYEEAIPYYKDAYAARRETAPDSKATLQTLKHYASTLTRINNHKLAASLYEILWEKERQTRGDNDSATLATALNLATCYYHLGEEGEDAIRNLRKAADIHKDLVDLRKDEESFLLMISREGLANDLVALKQYQDAINLFHEIMASISRLRGKKIIDNISADEAWYRNKDSLENAIKGRNNTSRGVSANGRRASERISPARRRAISATRFGGGVSNRPTVLQTPVSPSVKQPRALSEPSGSPSIPKSKNDDGPSLDQEGNRNSEPLVLDKETQRNATLAPSKKASMDKISGDGMKQTAGSTGSGKRNKGKLPVIQIQPPPSSNQPRRAISPSTVGPIPIRSKSTNPPTKKDRSHKFSEQNTSSSENLSSKSCPEGVAAFANAAESGDKRTRPTEKRQNPSAAQPADGRKDQSKQSGGVRKGQQDLIKVRSSEDVSINKKQQIPSVVQVASALRPRNQPTGRFCDARIETEADDA